MLKVVLAQLLKAVLEYKWYVVIFAAVSVIFCGIIYFKTRSFNWSRRTIRAFSIFCNLNSSGRIALSLLLGRLVFVFCTVLFGGSEGLWDLLILVLFCLFIAIISRSWKEIVHILSYVAVYIVCLMENLFIGFHQDVDSSPIILIIGISFGLFAFLYACYQTLTSYNTLLTRAAIADKMRFDEAFYEKKKPAEPV